MTHRYREGVLQTAQARSALDAACADGVALGVTVCVAAGDGGSSDGVSDGQPHVDFPASSLHALACGGACSGLGSPDGTALLSALTATTGDAAATG